MAVMGVPKRPFALEIDASKEIRSRILTLERKTAGLREQRQSMSESLVELDLDITDHMQLCASYEQLLSQQP